MNQSKVAVRYAKAAYEFAKEEGKKDSFIADMRELDKLLSSNNEIISYFDNPTITTGKKLKTTDLLFSKAFDPVTISVIKLIVKNNRESYFSSICRKIEEAYKKENGISSLEIISATELDNETRDILSKNVKKALSADKMEIKETTNQDIIGGFILRMDNLQYDASIKSQLERLKQELKAK